jgi:hypothetical protein
MSPPLISAASCGSAPAAAQNDGWRTMFDYGCWMLDVGCWMLDVGLWILDYFSNLFILA